MRNPPPFGKWDFPTYPTLGSPAGGFEPGFRRFIPTNVGTPDGEPNLVGNPPSRKWQIGIWASPGPHLGTGPLPFNLPRKKGVPRPRATHHRLRLTETVSLLQISWGVLWICQSGAPKRFPSGKNPGLRSSSCLRRFLDFQKLGAWDWGVLFRAKVAVLVKLSPKMEPPRTQLRIHRICRI